MFKYEEYDSENNVRKYESSVELFYAVISFFTEQILCKIFVHFHYTYRLDMVLFIIFANSGKPVIKFVVYTRFSSNLPRISLISKVQ